MYMQIKPKIGFDDIRLGIPRKQVLKILGEPLSKSTLTSPMKDEEEYDCQWAYMGGVNLTFYYEYGYLLSQIDIRSGKIWFREKNLIGMLE